MVNLHSEFFYNQDPSQLENNFQAKIEDMAKLDSTDWGIVMDEKTKHLWKSAIKEVSRMSEV